MHVTCSHDLSDSDRTTLEDLVLTVRDLMVAAAHTALPATEIGRAIGRISEITDFLEQMRRPGVVRAPFAEPAAARLAGVPVAAGLFNPLGLPFQLHIEPDGDAADAQVIPSSLWEGPPGHVHGGVLSWLFDLVLGMLVQSGGTRSVTATLTVDYLLPTPITEALEVKASLTSRQGRTTYAEATISSGGRVTARATGRFVDIDALR